MVLNGKLRLAKPEDIPVLAELVEQFVLQEMPPPVKTDRSVIEDTITKLVTCDKKHGIVILWDVDGKIGGFILGTAVPSMFSSEIHAAEIAYHVLPEYRKSKAYKELLETYESWAKEIATADIISVALLDKRVGKLYERKGYSFTEMSYKKEL